MLPTRVFQSGHSMAVRIPKAISSGLPVGDAEIMQVGNTWMIRPIKRKSLADIGETVAGFKDTPVPLSREFHEDVERDW
jgi:virulence-associated protein VagC